MRAATPGSGWPTVPALLPVCVSLPALEVGGVDGDHRGHLGAAVAFQQFDAELFAEGVGDGLAEFLGAHQHVAQAGEFLRGALAGVGGAEGRRGEQQGGLVLVRRVRRWRLASVGLGW